MRTYNDLCGIARALDVVGERWALLIVRELVLGPKRFTDLRAGLPGIGPDMLAARLRDLETAGVVTRRTLDPPARARVYELTDRGRALRPVLLELGRWGSTLAPQPKAAFGADSGVLALATLFDPERDPKFEATIGLRLDEQPFALRIAEGELDAARGAPEAPAATISTSPHVFAAVLWEGRELAAAERAGELAIDGDRAAVERFTGLFPLPG